MQARVLFFLIFLHISEKSCTFAAAKVFTMEDNFAIQLFEGKKVRIVWDEEQEKYYFSVVDIVQVLTESTDGRKYWNKLKQRLKEEGNESVTNCHQLKLLSSGGYLPGGADRPCRYLLTDRGCGRRARKNRTRVRFFLRMSDFFCTFAAKYAKTNIRWLAVFLITR